jgi:L-aspartate semialdehyde sulfurtransferase ferredoxin
LQYGRTWQSALAYWKSRRTSATQVKSVRKRVTLIFPRHLVNVPLTYRLAKDFDVAANIVRARVTPNEVGTLVVELSGDIDQVEAGLEWVQSLGIEVAERAKEIQIDPDLCVDCGLCTGVCPTEALKISAPDWKLEFLRNRCVMCEQCIPTCPVGAISTSL